MGIVKVDLCARILPDDHKCYFVFPGRGYKYFDLMMENGVVFVDLPNLPRELFFKGDAEEDKIEREQLIRDGVVRSILYRRWIHVADSISFEEYYADNYERASQQSRTISSYIGFLNNIYLKIAKGSLFILPAPGMSGDVMIGEFLEESSVVENIESPEFPNLVYTVRRVKWLRRIEKYKLNGEILRRLASPNPVRLIEQGLYKYIYDMAYGQYKYRDHYCIRIDTDSVAFGFSDNLILNLFIIDSIRHSAEVANYGFDFGEHKFSVGNIERLEGLLEQRITINSPGSIIISAKNVIPFIIAVQFATCSVVAADSAVPDVVITNSIQNDDVAKSCSIGLEEEVRAGMRMAGYDDWRDRCIKQRRLEIQGKMKTQTKGIVMK